MIGKINVYTCPNGHQTITKDVDEGVTPFMLKCRSGCNEMARSCFYNCDQTLKPKYEWFKPSQKEFNKMDKPMQEHIKQGGLDLRTYRD